MLSGVKDTLLGRLPDFICIGGQRCGTTWLHRQLALHPAIFVPDRKELDYFIGGERSRMHWRYRRHFRPASRGEVLGELSPKYMPRADPSEIVRQVPGVKLFCILRDPAERAYSQWKMARGRGGIDADAGFLDSFEGDLRYMRSRGEYASLIERYEGAMPNQEQVQVYFFDDLLDTPVELLRSVFTFLGVDDSFIPDGFEEVIYASSQTDRMPRDERAHLVDYYRSEILRLEERTGRRLDAWRTP